MTDTHLTSLTDDDGDATDQLLQIGLREVLGGETPPDLSEQILAEFNASPTSPTRLVSLAKRKVSRSTRLALLWAMHIAVAASLLAMLSGVERRMSNATRAGNINNSRQIGLAALNHESALSGFPKASYYFDAPSKKYTVTVPEQRTRTEHYTVMVPEQKTPAMEYRLAVPDEPALVYPDSEFWDDISNRRLRYGAQDASLGVKMALNNDSQGMVDGAGKKAIDRKIRYNASAKIVVDQFDDVADKVAALVKRHEGFVASANLGQMRGEQRSGSWVVRIPTANYDAFMGSIDEVGVLDSQHQKAQDVTVQYVDLESRIVSKQKLEERIIKLLERPDDKLKDVIEVERELARVRTEIEQMQGQLRVMADQTSLATVTLNVREERDFVPPTAPTVSSRLANAWSNGFSRSGSFLMNLAIWFIERFIPIAVCVIAAIVSLRSIRAWWNRRSNVG